MSWYWGYINFILFCLNYVLDSIFYFHKDDEITLYLGQLELYDA